MQMRQHVRCCGKGTYGGTDLLYVVIYNRNDGLTPIVLYDYQPSRKGSCVQEFLEGFHGMVQCDGYQGYNRLEDVILVCCLAHARRKFFEAVPAARRKS